MQLITRKGILHWSVAVVLAMVALPVSVAGEDTTITNAVQMVTYFPVAYVSYDTLTINKKLDIGSPKFEVTTNKFTADKITLKNIDENKGSALIVKNLDVTSLKPEGATTGGTVRFGGSTPNSETQADISFIDLYLFPTDTTKQNLVVRSLRLFDGGNIKASMKDANNSYEPFPYCSKMQWTKENTKYYLVCQGQHD